MSSGVRQFLAAFLAVMALSSCTVEVENRPVPVRPQVCTLDHAPVCARRGNREQTFSNACMARASGFQVMHRGECRIGGGPGFDRPVACTREFAPVCGRRGPQQRTFANACLARAEGFRVSHAGECRMGGGPGFSQPIACTREFAPVCVVRGNRFRTFDNSCLARAENFRTVHPGVCR